MIWTAVFYVLSLVLRVVALLFSAIGYAIPDAFETALAQLFSYLSYVQGILPIVADPTLSGLASQIGLLDVLGYAFGFLVAWYSFKVVMFTLKLLPFLNIGAGRTTEKHT